MFGQFCLTDATERLFGAEGVFAITENDVFDPLYSMLRYAQHFNTACSSFTRLTHGCW